MTRLWSRGQPISVTSLSAAKDVKLFSKNGPIIDNVPEAFQWRGKDHRVVEINRYWRVDIDWWRERIWRAYFKLRTDTGLLVVIYQDMVGGNWFLERLFD